MKKTVLVTGATGFIGSHLVNVLFRETNWSVKAWDNYVTGRNNLPVEVQHVDVSNRTQVLDSIEKVDVIFHLGAFARIQPSFDRPAFVHDSNINGTLNILEVARRVGAKVVYAGSSSAYAGPYKNPYAFTKWVGEEYCRMYNAVYDVPIAVARFFNVYGPRQPSEGAYATVIGIFEKQKAAGLPLTITSDGEQRRDFCHVLDIARGLKKMAETDVTQICNLGTGVNYSINEVADMFGGSRCYIPKRPGEADITLAEMNPELDWKAEISLKNYIEGYLSTITIY